MIVARINLHGGNTYTQSMEELGVLIDEIRTAAECGSIGEQWSIELIEMSESEYAALPDFEGH